MLQSMGSQRVGHNWVTELFVESCLTLCDPMDHSPPGSSVHAIFQARVLEWGSIAFSVQLLSHVQLSVTPWTTARQASLSITNSQSLPKLMSIESVMPSNHLILCCHLLLLPSIFPNIRSFQMSQLFASGGQSTGVSASTSVLPMNTQG